jgi:hypothetical protein
MGHNMDIGSRNVVARTVKNGILYGFKGTEFGVELEVGNR